MTTHSSSVSSPIAVIGAGAWGLALALQAHRAGHDVVIWARDPAGIGARLPGHAIPPDIIRTGVLPDRDIRFALLAVPCQHIRATLKDWQPDFPLVICAKGVESTTLRLPGEICAELFPHAPLGVLTGPNFAHEIAAGLPAAAVMASQDDHLRRDVITALATPPFRLYASTDPVGAQVGGAAKNVIAIAAGAAMGAGLGENARAALITRGVAELGRLAVALGGQMETAAGLSGLGDLLLTCTGTSSRNYSLGLRLGQGEPLAAILAARSAVTEGVHTAPALARRATTLGVDAPICQVVADLVTGQANLDELVRRMLARSLKAE